MSTPSDNSDSKVKVAVRVRPFNRREIELETQCIVQVNGQQILLHNPISSHIPTIKNKENHSDNSSNQQSNGSSSNNNNSLSRVLQRNSKQFAFDHCFWSFNESDEHFASQEQVYQDLGLPVLESSFQGYNACIFAYGQTGSGKSYTMLGSASNKGLIPRLCDGIFERIHACKNEKTTFKVEVSYMEIYNERVHDLLDPKGIKSNLRVREHNILGPYVDGLSKLAVSSFEQIDNLMSEGNKSRTVAATNMNSESSRSHAVFTITLTCSTYDDEAGVTGEKVSKMSLVDLAGSERAVKTGAVGDRLKEGSNINKSLTTLGLVISKLADSASGKNVKEQFVPYRDSVLTWLLKDNLGGNSKTVMVATVSPAADNFEESLSTLRYADRAKRIVNHAIVNEDPNARMIRELKEEVEVLREQLKNATQSDVLKERLQESEKLIKEMTLTWEERLRQTEVIHEERQKQLEKMGISVQSSGIRVQTDKYYLVNLNSDPSMNELLVYYLKDQTLVGRSDAKREQDIQLSGIGIQEEHAIIQIQDNNLYMIPLNNARTCVNGSVIKERTLLSHGDRILWGNNHFFKVSCPKRSSSAPAAAVPPDSSKQSADDTAKHQSGYTSFSEMQSSSSSRESDSPHDHHPHSHDHDLLGIRDSSEDNEYSSIDFDFAREELMMKELSNDPIQTTVIKSLEKQHEEDKKLALEKQKKMYEKQLQLLRNQISPTAPHATPVTGSQSYMLSSTMLQSSDSFGSSSRLNALTVNQNKIDKWAKERDELFKKSLTQLKEDIVRANALVLEANAFSQEMSCNTE
jgi:kinesin family protein 13